MIQGKTVTFANVARGLQKTAEALTIKGLHDTIGVVKVTQKTQFGFSSRSSESEKCHHPAMQLVNLVSEKITPNSETEDKYQEKR